MISFFIGGIAANDQLTLEISISTRHKVQITHPATQNRTVILYGENNNYILITRTAIC